LNINVASYNGTVGVLAYTTVGLLTECRVLEIETNAGVDANPSWWKWPNQDVFDGGYAIREAEKTFEFP
jgi:hypothetical protein